MYRIDDEAVIWRRQKVELVTADPACFGRHFDDLTLHGFEYATEYD